MRYAAMNKRIIVVMGFFAILIFYTGIADGYWEWTPKTRKWINPKNAVKNTPEEQFSYGMELYNSKDYDKAITEFKKLLKHYPSSKEAPEAQWTIGLAYEVKDEHYKAFESYQKVVEEYPSTERINEIIGREFKIANLFYEGKKKRVMGVIFFPSIDKAIEIFKKVIENAPYGEYADISQYKIGLCHMKQLNYEDAKVEFEKLINEYPKSSLADDAKYQIAFASSLMSLKAPYDQEALEEGIKVSEEFSLEYTESELGEDVKDIKAQLRSKEAEKAFQIARFYEKKKKLGSARIYYESIVKDYPESHWAVEAKKRLEILGGANGN